MPHQDALHLPRIMMREREREYLQPDSHSTVAEVERGFVELLPVDDALKAQWPSMPSWRAGARARGGHTGCTPSTEEFAHIRK